MRPAFDSIALWTLKSPLFPLFFLPVRQGEVLDEVEVLQAHEVELVVCDFFPQSLYVMTAAMLILAKL